MDRVGSANRQGCRSRQPAPVQKPGGTVDQTGVASLTVNQVGDSILGQMTLAAQFTDGDETISLDFASSYTGVLAHEDHTAVALTLQIPPTVAERREKGALSDGPLRTCIPPWVHSALGSGRRGTLVRWGLPKREVPQPPHTLPQSAGGRRMEEMSKSNEATVRRSVVGLLLLAVLLLAGCGGDDVEPEPPPVATTVEITPDSVELLSSGATKGVNAVVRDRNGKAMPNASVSWTGSDPAVFTVDGNGQVATVTAVASGTGTLTATSGQASGTASVTVVQTPAKLGHLVGKRSGSASGDGAGGAAGRACRGAKRWCNRRGCDQLRPGG